MSYQYYLDHINYLIALGVYNAPVNYATIPYMPLIVPAPNLQPIFPQPRNEALINVNSESDEENDVDERTLFCANLAENVTEELLYEVFFQAGPLDKVYIPKSNNGENRTYGFVTYKYRSTPPYAMKLYKGLVLFGKRLDIKFQGKLSSNGYLKR